MISSSETKSLEESTMEDPCPVEDVEEGPTTIMVVANPVLTAAVKA